MILLLITVIALLGWGVKLINVDLKKLELEIFELEKSNKELIEANIKLTQKINKKLKNNEINPN